MPSDGAPTLLPRAAVIDARQVLRQFARDAGAPALAAALAAEDPKELSADAGARWPGPRLLDSPFKLMRLLGSSIEASPTPGGMTLSLAGPAHDLIDFARPQPEPVRRAMDVVLARALEPASALDTWPEDAFFDDEERRLLDRLPISQDLADPAVDGWAPGTDFDYRGYVCAIVKLTRLCNLRCVYCHDWRSGPDQTMPLDVLSTAICRLLGDPAHGTVDFVWHGGEPTVLGRRAFLRVLALQQRFRRPGQIIRNVIQTNGLGIDEAWIAFLGRYGFRVGISLDGPPALHDETRPDAGGRPTSSRVVAALRRMQEAGLVQSVLMVVGSKTIEAGAAALVDFAAETGIAAIALLPVRPVAGAGMTADASHVDIASYVDFLLAVERERRRRPGLGLAVRELDAAKRAVAGESPGFCEMLGNCIGAFFSIEADGRVAHCDKYAGDAAYTLGNVLSDDFGALRRSATATRIATENRRRLDRLDCAYARYCRGWCPHEGYVAMAKESGGDGRCCGLQRLFAGLQSAGG